MSLFSSALQWAVAPVLKANEAFADSLGDWQYAIPFVRDKAKSDYQKQVDARNFANEDRSFAEQQFLNRNGLLLQAYQAQKMGMNPMSMSAGSYGSFPATPVSSSVGSGNSDSIIGSLLSLFGSKYASDKNAETSKDVANINAKSAEKVAEINAGASKYSADSSRLGAWERTIADNDNLTARNKKNIESAERIAKQKIGAQKAEIASNLLKYNTEAQQQYIKDKAKLLDDMYEYFLKQSTGITVKGASDWYSSFARNVSVGFKTAFDTITPKQLRKMNRDAFANWFDSTFDYAPFSPINIDEFLKQYGYGSDYND